MNPKLLFRVSSFLLALTTFSISLMAQDVGSHPDAGVERFLVEAGENRTQIERALSNAPQTQASAMQFLVENMPTTDLQTLDAEFLLDHVRIAFEARDQAKWGKRISEDIFLNSLLPYANVNEQRDDVRRELRQKFWPLVQELDSISLAAAKLNQEVFKQLNVKYSTKRRRADQGPIASMESGIASCTGLSILLIDACRACGVPARFVGTPLWSDGSGNHSWVEIWDDGWHFTGAAEPTGDRLDQAWFTGRAAKATLGAKHGVFAVSFKRTDHKFPMVWLRSNHQVFAEEVTARYAKPQKVITGMVEIRFRATDLASSNRCQANLVIRDKNDAVVFRGETKGESADANDHITAQLPIGDYSVELSTSTGLVRNTFTADVDGKLVSLAVNDAPVEIDAIKQLRAYCQLHADEPPEQLLDIAQQKFAKVGLTQSQSQEASAILVDHYQQLMESGRRKEHDEKTIVIGDLEMKYGMTIFGSQPDRGHCLVISMHGGGGTTKLVNDEQWQNQKQLYKLDEGIYVAPRAPTDAWNLWHQAHIDAFFTRLIAIMIAFEHVDPDRIYITGYSAGGDGVYQLAPRMADQLAAAAMMAGHPNETQPIGLRNLPFTLHVGGNDAAYDRNKIAQKWMDSLAKLHEDDPEGYTHWAKVHEGKGHWMDRQETEGVEWMQQYSRNLTPNRVVWLQDDVTHKRFYWLAVDDEGAKARSKIVAVRDGNNISIEESDVENFSILLRDEMLDLDQAVTVSTPAGELLRSHAERTIATLARTLADRGDRNAMFSASVLVEMPQAVSSP